uniref:Protein O-mannosyl-transferase 2 n=1 Tax=Phallusia mammillata TaxID=59560 RepID=A0A6F9DNL2_9ASCI|nr:protein O-mannosyl-transferase 2-like [Phallusia mammillata]
MLNFIKHDCFISCGAVTLISFITRYYMIETPPYVCWDETHFGKMAGLYIKQTFFFDVHPPLGKLLIAGSAHLFGYDGTFAFSSASEYSNINQTQESVPYVKMRLFSALFGSLLIPLIFQLVLTLTENKCSAYIASMFLAFDCGLITLSQYILLDSIMLFFMMGAVAANAKLTIQQGNMEKYRFSIKWWMCLLSTGFLLGCALSTKFVGVLTVIYVGAWTLWDLFIVWFESISWSVLLKYICAKVFGLICLPIALYIFVFWLHFKVLVNNGKGADLYSTSFQASLLGNPFHNTTVPKVVTSKNFITLRSSDYGGVILHSHNRPFPDSVHTQHLQQVTGYLAKDSNNIWNIMKVNNNENNTIANSIKHGDVVQLTHLKTKSRLAVVLNDINRWASAPLSTNHLLVTTVQNSSRFVAQGSDQWKIQMLENQTLCPIECPIRLINVATHCYLHLSDQTLPDWGWKQREVTCVKQRLAYHNWWFVESVINFNKTVSTKPIPVLSFWQKLLESHGVMFAMNSRLVAKRGVKWSKPWQWPVLNEGQLFSRSSEKVYLYGTPLVWWTNVFSLCLFPVVYALTCRYSIQFFGTRKYRLTYNIDIGVCGCFAIAWLIHYGPFFFMKRVLFFHHYFPAHIFACCLSGVFLNMVSENFAQSCSTMLHMDPVPLHHTVLAILTALTIGSFYQHIDICYGVSA